MNVKTAMTAALVCGVAALSGCASMSSKGDPSAMIPPGDNGGHSVVDTAYVSAVNQQADESGVQEIWLNPPEKRTHN
ncbi:MAG TPA: hypothetical protein VK753_13770 [Xanthomonadaceae bacterium]|jgi:hypothetical protein|nr:hypothetical protein [Xanthomonadaceae bacterium]